MSNLVSVIMPYYRKRKYIKKAVNSVINQSYKKWELIIVYDDSDREDLDYLKDIIKKYKRIILLVNKKIWGLLTQETWLLSNPKEVF